MLHISICIYFVKGYFFFQLFTTYTKTKVKLDLIQQENFARKTNSPILSRLRFMRSERIYGGTDVIPTN